MNYITDDYIRTIMKPRQPEAHKGDFGKVLIYAGSPGMAGAAILAGRAALRSGAGLVRYLLPSLQSPLYPILQTAVPEATCVFEKDISDYSEYTAIAAGPGLGKTAEARRILKNILLLSESVIVLDADALNIISADEELAFFVKSSPPVIITPHVGEAKRLLNSREPINAAEERETAVRALREKFGCISVLKGAGTIVCGDELYINTTGNPGMATGGSGDVLTGLIAGLAAQKYSPEEAARLGVFLHGKAGDLARDAKGEMGLIASDIVEFLPEAEKNYLSPASPSA